MNRPAKLHLVGATCKGAKSFQSAAKLLEDYYHEYMGEYVCMRCSAKALAMPAPTPAPTPVYKARW